MRDLRVVLCHARHSAGHRIDPLPFDPEPRTALRIALHTAWQIEGHGPRSIDLQDRAQAMRGDRREWLSGEFVRVRGHDESAVVLAVMEHHRAVADGIVIAAVAGEGARRLQRDRSVLTERLAAAITITALAAPEVDAVVCAALTIGALATASLERVVARHGWMGLGR